jgi:hypothetical protein
MLPSDLDVRPLGHDPTRARSLSCLLSSILMWDFLVSVGFIFYQLGNYPEPKDFTRLQPGEAPFTKDR